MSAPGTFSIGRAVLDPVALTLTGPGGTVPLNRQPVRLLARLVRDAGRVVPLDDLVGSLRNRYGRGSVDLVQSHMVAVRRALRDSGSGAVAHTVYGAGVRLDLPADTAGSDSQEAA